MFPTFQLFERTIGFYGIMIVIGFLVGITMMVLRSKLYHIRYEDALFASFFGGIGLFIGAKLFYLLLSIPKFIRFYYVFVQNPALLLPAISDGFVFYGGLLGAFLGLYIYSRMFSVKFLQILDLAAPSIPIIHGFGRIGCFFSGCCYGVPYQGVGHIIFQHSLSAPNHVALLPIQLIESGINFLVGILLLYYARNLNTRNLKQLSTKNNHTVNTDDAPCQKCLESSNNMPRNAPSGRLIGCYLVSYAFLRFIMEFFRGDMIRGIFFGISTSQWISLLFLPIGTYLILGRERKSSLKK